MTATIAPEPRRCPVCSSTRCLAGTEYAPGKHYSHRWEDGPMAAAHARWKDDRTPPASPEEAIERGLIKPEIGPEPATDHTTSAAADNAATDNPTPVATDNLRQCEECGNPFEAKRSDARFCSSTCRSKASRRPEQAPTDNTATTA
jgi:ferredoxin